MKSIQTHYDNLGVSRSAPDEVIRAAYRTLSKIHHPDMNPDNADAVKRMRSINESYEILCTPLKRKLYDEWLRQQESYSFKHHEPPPDKPLWKTGPAMRIRKRRLSFRSRFVLSAGTILFSLVFVIAFYDPLLQLIPDFGIPAGKTVPKEPGLQKTLARVSVIDSEMKSIPRIFIGDDIAGLFARETASFPPKDEFEKLETYKTRFRSSIYHRQYVFTSPFGRISSYDIDRKLISVVCTDSSSAIGTIPVISDSKPATQSEGVSAPIPEITNYSLKDIREEKGFAHYLASALTFRISPEEGRELKKHLGILIIATPEVDSTGKTVSDSRMNEYEPFYQLGRIITNRYVHSLINAIWVYNTATGAVHFKKTFEVPPGKVFSTWLRNHPEARVTESGDSGVNKALPSLQ
jgi:curved DNA-binding protein CbpA